ncbi:MAG TPA: helix-turn-helix transcriptional regulator [Stellaceae bacterium]|nr:helix-turn-helix transcriptional regulator [Stellaceae bacterium]
MPTRSTNRDDYQRVPRPVAAMAKDFPSGFVIPPHSHPRAQLIYAADGVMRVISPLGAWVVPPLRAVWIPAGVEHEVRMSGAVAMRTLYIDPKAAPPALGSCTVIEVTPLLRALILRAVEEPIEYDEAGAAGLVMGLILAELARATAVPLRIPLPSDTRLAALCRALLDDPAEADTLDRWAERVGASARTLARLFQRETGMGFTQWRQQVRLAEAVGRLAKGDPVARVAESLGYGSASAFTAMFRRTLGATPRHYLGRNRRETDHASDVYA